ncbi:uncharacterized protein PAC_07596 [Phialocephala subalpina]|uniref:EKC/KEOPS complex subunit BUD32 n=1 Tax=Phialocephala subalpina TaxID=576137 RepID=A0A1L7WY67_9HELO|nr:uncharacterized protein PAC_07596 [Phialocephala subalpina]
MIFDDSESRPNEEGTSKNNAKEQGTDNPRVYYHQTSDNIENIENYRVGGYHPVALGGTLNGHYNILHKLGHGGFSTVWLAQDTDKAKYVAIKVIMAEASEEAMNVEETGMDKVSSESARFGDFVNFPTECFWIAGPNGLHLAIVSPLAGPSLAQLVEATQFGEMKQEHVLGGRMAQRLALQITQAVSFFHNAGIGHGDLTCNNMLLELQNLDHLAPEALLKLLGHSQVEVVARLDAKRVQPTAPKYAIEPANALNLLPYWTGNIKIIDFGTVYSLNDPPKDLNTPFSSCPPEYLLFDKVGKEADIWALGVLIYKIRACKDLFPDIMGEDWEVLTQMEEFLGPIASQDGSPVALIDLHDDSTPSTEREEPLLSELIHSINVRKSREDPEDKDRKADVGVTETLSQRKLGRQDICGAEGDSREIGQIDQVQRREQLIELTVDGLKNGRTDLKVAVKGESVSGRISREEADLLIDLLQGALNYDVGKRLSSDEMLRHPWFSKNF